MPKKFAFSSVVIKVFLIGAGLMLVFYAVLFRISIIETENMVMERRIHIVAPYHFKRFEQGQIGVLEIDPLLSIYDQYALLPLKIRNKISQEWQGYLHLTFSDETELQLLAMEINTPIDNRIVYALENSDAVELSDRNLVMFELSLLFVGIFLFLLISTYMISTVKRAAKSFHDLAHTLESANMDDFSPFIVTKKETFEFEKIIRAINSYRSRLKNLIAREQSFTRYISHELRTPMTVIKGSISNIRLNEQKNVKKYIDKIGYATEQMHELTNTFLMLARDDSSIKECVEINQDFIGQAVNELEDKIDANQVEFHWQLESSFSLFANQLLLKVAIQNLLSNAMICSNQGKVMMFISASGIDIVDNGVALQSSHRGLDGFGIGLVLVEDICKKYDWVFSLHNNLESGCTANIRFSVQS
ncbi:sensor histidine kinase [Agaribacter marinus]|uniref:histidine kinase n=1 Tax=Agaribacter marinus TaxID=1431249 RepID=A0AA37T0D4_9ALTE|nr:HAMP domain-containing sensor histidine kinase [Agaribacter marinus]GLR70028.1 two-component sensor histidine kinase [Agaribacter marinus]